MTASDEPAWQHRGVSLALLALMPAALLFAIRAGFRASDHSDAAISSYLGIGGSLALLGIILLVVATWKAKGRVRHRAWGAGLLAAAHQFVLPHAPNIGATMVYLAIGTAGTVRDRRCLWAAALAALGSLLRSVHADFGEGVLAVGAGLLAVTLVWAARPDPSDRHG